MTTQALLNTHMLIPLRMAALFPSMFSTRFVHLILLIFTALGAHGQDAKPALKLTAASDFLALHVTGTAPAGATAVEYRIASAGEIGAKSAWVPVANAPGAEGAFAFEVKLERSRWTELQVRALRGDTVLATKETRPSKDAFKLLRPEHLAAMPEGERTAWTAYVDRSRERVETEFDTLATECRALGLANARPAPGSRAEFEFDSDTAASWFAGAEARALADAVMSYQTPTGGWSKAVDYSQGPRQPGTHWTAQTGEGGWHYCGTIDNGTTTEQIKLLAGVSSATKRDDARAAALRGIEYLLEAQFPNGGWPQNYPLESGYHEAITLNDNAMVHVLEVLLDVADAKVPFAFAHEALRQRARAAFDKGVACLAAMQVSINGQRTVWCAQHHPLTLDPAHARSKEPPSFSGGESAGVLKFLMRSAPVTAQTTAMIESGLAWLDAHRITGLRKVKNAEGKTDYVADPASTEVYWARFYDLKTSKPIFPGSQDGVLYATFSEMAAKNKVAYDFVTAKPGELLAKEKARWQKRLAKEKP